MNDLNTNIQDVRDIQDAPLVEGGHTFSTITEKISSIVENPAPKGWWIAFLGSLYRHG